MRDPRQVTKKLICKVGRIVIPALEGCFTNGLHLAQCLEHSESLTKIRTNDAGNAVREGMGGKELLKLLCSPPMNTTVHVTRLLHRRLDSDHAHTH